MYINFLMRTQCQGLRPLLILPIKTGTGDVTPGSQAFFALMHLESDASDAHQPPIDNEAASPLPLTIFCSAGSHGLIQVLLCQLPKSFTPCTHSKTRK
jgi:hypothetical protein